MVGVGGSSPLGRTKNSNENATLRVAFLFYIILFNPPHTHKGVTKPPLHGNNESQCQHVSLTYNTELPALSLYWISQHRDERYAVAILPPGTAGNGHTSPFGKVNYVN